jgi:hypothetical protein
MPSRHLNRRFAALAVAAALLLLPATTTLAAQPVDSHEGGFTWSLVLHQLSDLFASWFGTPEPEATQRVTGEDQLGSLLDPDGVVAPDPTSTTNAYPEPGSGGELGSLLDPDG